MSFYTFNQNNSGGRFIGFPYIVIEADSAEQANDIAEEYGVYFNGAGDCECCGRRWWRVNEDDATDVPTKFGEPVSGNDPEILIVYI